MFVRSVHKAFSLLVALALVLGLTACSTSPTPDSSGSPTPENPGTSTGTDDTVYTLYLSEQTYRMDHNGNLLGPEEADSFTLSDARTGEDVFTVHSRVEDTGERNEWGDPVGHYLQAVYDMDGNLVADWGPYKYTYAIGDYLLRQDNLGGLFYPDELPEGFYSALWNYKTGEELYLGAFSISQATTGGHVVVSNIWSKPIALLDAENQPLDLPAEAEWYSLQVCGNGFIAQDKSPYDYYEDTVYALLDKNLEVVFTCSRLGNWSDPGDFIRYSDGDEVGVMDYSGNKLYTTPPGYEIEYFDGELVILMRKETQPLYTLQTVAGDTYLKNCQRIEAIWDYNTRTPAQLFYAVDNESLSVVGRDGAVTASRPLADIHPNTQDLSFSYENSEYFSYNVLAEDMWRTGLLDSNLETVVPAEKYDYISLGTDYTVFYDVMFGGRVPAGGLYNRTDLLDMKGNVILTDLSAVGTVGPNRIAVVRGFSYGLIDFEGNWIAEYPLFDHLVDD